MDIQRATIEQVRTGRDGRKVTITSDTLDVVRQIKELSPRLEVVWNDAGEYFMIAEHCLDGKVRPVITTPTLDQRVVNRLKLIGSEHYDANKEADAIDAAVEKEKDRKFKEQIGEVGERLFSAMRKDLEVKDRTFVSKDVA